MDDALTLMLMDAVEQADAVLDTEGVLVEFFRLGEAEDEGVLVGDPELVAVAEPQWEGEEEAVEEELRVTVGDDEGHFEGDGVAVDEPVALDEGDAVGEKVTDREEQDEGVEQGELEGEGVKDTEAVGVVVEDTDAEGEAVPVPEAVEQGVAERVGVDERQ